MASFLYTVLDSLSTSTVLSLLFSAFTSGYYIFFITFLPPWKLNNKYPEVSMYGIKANFQMFKNDWFYVTLFVSTINFIYSSLYPKSPRCPKHLTDHDWSSFSPEVMSQLPSSRGHFTTLARKKPSSIRWMISHTKVHYGIWEPVFSTVLFSFLVIEKKHGKFK